MKAKKSELEILVKNGHKIFDIAADVVEAESLTENLKQIASLVLKLISLNKEYSVTYTPSTRTYHIYNNIGKAMSLKLSDRFDGHTDDSTFIWSANIGSGVSVSNINKPYHEGENSIILLYNHAAKGSSSWDLVDYFEMSRICEDVPWMAFNKGN